LTFFTIAIDSTKLGICRPRSLTQKTNCPSREVISRTLSKEEGKEERREERRGRKEEEEKGKRSE
jgi:hypothetical protein